MDKYTPVIAPLTHKRWQIKTIICCKALGKSPNYIFF